MSISGEYFIGGFVSGLIIGESAVLFAVALFRRNDTDFGEEHLPQTGAEILVRPGSRHFHELIDS